MTPYLLTCYFYRKMSRYNVFQYRMSYLGALYDNFETFRKKIQWEGIFENRGAVPEISTDFRSENGFELTKYTRINFFTIIGTIHDLISFPL